MFVNKFSLPHIFHIFVKPEMGVLEIFLIHNEFWFFDRSSFKVQSQPFVFVIIIFTFRISYLNSLLISFVDLKKEAFYKSAVTMWFLTPSWSKLLKLSENIIFRVSSLFSFLVWKAELVEFVILDMKWKASTKFEPAGADKNGKKG